MTILTPLGGLLLAIYIAVNSQTATSSTFALFMSVAAGICFLLDLFFYGRGGAWRTRPTA